MKSLLGDVEWSVSAAVPAAASTATSSATTPGTGSIGAAEPAIVAPAVTAAAFTAPTAATIATAASTTAAVCTASATARGTRLHGPSLVDNDVPAAHRLAIHAADCGLCLGITTHFDETEAFGTAGIALHHDFCADHGAELAKSLL